MNDRRVALYSGDNVQRRLPKFYQKNNLFEINNELSYLRENDLIQEVIQTVVKLVTSIFTGGFFLNLIDIVLNLSWTAIGIIGAITGVTGGVASVTRDSSKIKKTLLISAGCILGVVLIYFIYKLVKFLKRFFSKNDDKKKQKNRKEKNKK